GLLGLAILLAASGMWLWQTRTTKRDIYHWWGFSVLGVLAIHSLLEYPLWYLYFMGVAAVMLGLFDTTAYQLELRRLGRLSLGTMVVLGVVSLAQLLPGYQRLEGVMVLRNRAASAADVVPRIQQELLAVHQVPLLSSYAELFITSTMEVSADNLEQKLALNERALRFIPIAPGAYNQVLLLALSGREAEARVQLEDAIWAYPSGYATFRGSLEELERKDPARYAALLEFATQKYEEYRSAAVPGK
ncbi:MAG: Wzy polymerase domain-containing protein, partial [Gallionellaceae bacterium]|nr:Wzy polymerase domain-containing protein [Gallionellaceae bacterium]